MRNWVLQQVKNRGLSRLFLVVMGIWLIIALKPAWAEHSEWVINKHSQARLLTDVDSYTPGQTFHMALQLKLAPGWHTYWVNPGDAGGAPTLSLEGESQHRFHLGEIAWPVPQKIAEGPLLSFAYVGDVALVLPVSAKRTPFQTAPQASQKASSLHVYAQWLVCHDICVPEEGHFVLPLSSGAGTKGKDAPFFVQASSFLPLHAPFNAALDGQGNLVFTGHALLSGKIKSAYFMSSTQGQIDLAAPQIMERSKDRLIVNIKWQDGHPALPLRGIVTFTDEEGGARSYWIEVGTPLPLQNTATPLHSPMDKLLPHDYSPVAAPSPSSVLAASVPSFWSVIEIIGFAFVGGMILNIMPCIFPVLAVKAFSVAQSSHQELRQSQMGGLFYMLGVVLSFLLLGGILLIGRNLGQNIGWGAQFQSSAFVVGMCWFLCVIGLNLLGTFEVGQSITALGQNYVPAVGYGKDFCSGLLVVVLSTPCTAPFMGVAIAAAMTMPVWLGCLVFVMLGLGLAFPYAAVVSSPYLAHIMPRPGRWMEYTRQFLAFPLFVTCVWLLWVASLQGGATLLLGAALGCVGLGFACWLWGLAQKMQVHAGGKRYKNPVWMKLLALVMVASFCGWLVFDGGDYSSVSDDSALAHLSSNNGPASTQGHDGAPQHFSMQALERLRQSKQPVFVNITAAWCITCLVNERVALSTDAVQNAFKANHVTYMVGDWTRKNPEISRFLADHGREGVPFYLYFPPKGAAIALPQILTPAQVLHAIHT